MPHVIIEHSEDVAGQVELTDLVDAAHEATFSSAAVGQAQPQSCEHQQPRGQLCPVMNTNCQVPGQGFHCVGPVSS